MQKVPHIPYFQTSRYRVATMVELAKENQTNLPGRQEKGADLGSGDGRIAIAFAKAGIWMDGFETDKTLRSLAQENIKKEHLTNAVIYDKDFWQEDLSSYTIICCYPMPAIMGRLEHKLQHELAPGSRVLLNYFPFIHWKEKTIKDNIYLYIR